MLNDTHHSNDEYCYAYSRELQLRWIYAIWSIGALQFVTLCVVDIVAHRKTKWTGKTASDLEEMEENNVKLLKDDGGKCND